MKVLLTLGIDQVKNELISLSSPGLYWVSSERDADTRLFLRQIISNQKRVTLITSGGDPHAMLDPEISEGPSSIRLYSLRKYKNNLRDVITDIARIGNIKNDLVLFHASADLWDKLTSAEFYSWIRQIKQRLLKCDATLLIISSGKNIINIRYNLTRCFRQIDGMAHLEYQQDIWKYRIHWWYSGPRLVADRAIRLTLQNQRFASVSGESQPPLSADDADYYLADKMVLEGAPALSPQWQLYNDNNTVYSRAMQADSATVIFSLTHSNQISALARMIHSLRCGRGNGLKIVLREMATSLRYSDERLLLACGVNAIVPYGASLSRLLSTTEGIQGQPFSRHVPADLEQLITAMQPLQQRGFMQPDAFCEAVGPLMNNTLLPENGKGLLVALRPVPELKPRQVITLCKPRRYGDLVTLLADRLYLFLSSCRYHDLNTALKSIFSLPHDELFSNRMVWFEDSQIQAEIRQISELTPAAWRNKPLHPVDATSAVDAPAPVAVTRQQPQPVVLNLKGG